LIDDVLGDRWIDELVSEASLKFGNSLQKDVMVTSEDNRKKGGGAILGNLLEAPVV
jgi:hypothetical protein